jgi:hypothetical protein
VITVAPNELSVRYCFEKKKTAEKSARQDALARGDGMTGANYAFHCLGGGWEGGMNLF